MTTIHLLDALPADWGPCVVTLGVFDGVHRGHAQLIRRTVETAHRRGLPAVLVTFDPHPALVVGPPRDVAALSSISHRADLAGGLGIDAVCVLSFTREFAQLTPAEFVGDVLARTMRAAAVVVGANFTFGHRGGGTTETLAELCGHRGITTDVVGLLHQIDATCSSTSVRAALRRGDIRRATAALGRPHRIDVTITAQPDGALEIKAPGGSAVPSPGRYFTRIDGSVPSVISIGDDGRIHLCHPSASTGPTSIEFLDRLGHPDGQPVNRATRSAA
jgi:riboflavin kinase / FMN adenylyltransferase